VAVASRDGVTVHQHFGRATHFQIYELNRDGGGCGFRFLETRENEPACLPDSWEREGQAHERVVRLLADCQIVLAARIGPGARDVLQGHGLKVFEAPMAIEEALKRLIAAGVGKSNEKGGI